MLGKHNESDIRKRKAKSDNDNDHGVEPLDEDDQTRMIQQLLAQADQQQESILRIFRALCLVAAIVLALSVIYLDQWYLKSFIQRQGNPPSSSLVRPLSLAHGGCSAVLHALSPRLTKRKQKVGTIFRLLVAADVMAAVSALWVTRQFVNHQDETLLWMHYGIMASNALVVLAGILLKMDAESTDKAFTDLVDAKYRYKSL